MNFKLATVLILTILVGACSRGGGGGSPVPPVSTDPFFKAPITFDSSEMQNGAVGDFNNDGREDLVVTYMGSGNAAPWEGVEIKIFLQSESGTLVEAPNIITGPWPRIALARHIEVADFNDDGLDDIYFGNHGLELDSVPQSERYEPDVFLLSNGDGTYSDKTSNIPTFDVPPNNGFVDRSGTHNFYTHGVDSTDIDQDGCIDLAVNMTGGPGIAILVNNKVNGVCTGKFTHKTDALPVGLTADLWMHFIDVDGVNGPDLFVGNRNDAEHVIYINDGNNDFTVEPTIPLPVKLLPGIVEAAHTADVNGDTLPDLVIGNSNVGLIPEEDPLHYEQVLINNTTGIYGPDPFIDETTMAHPARLLGDNNGNAIFHMRDFDGDLDIDMLVVHGNGFNNETGLYLLEGNEFKRVTGTLEGLATVFVPIKIVGDDYIDIVSPSPNGTVLYKAKKKLVIE